MGAFSIDLAALEKGLKNSPSQKPSLDINQVPFESNKNKFVKVAFDMFQSKFDNTIWELAEDEGAKYLVKRTDLDDGKLETKTSDKNTGIFHQKGTWTAAAEPGKPVVLYVLSLPVREFSKTAFNYDDETATLFANHIVDKVSSSNELAKKYIQAMSKDNKQRLIKRCQSDLLDDELRRIYSLLVIKE